MEKQKKYPIGTKLNIDFDKKINQGRSGWADNSCVYLISNHYYSFLGSRDNVYYELTIYFPNNDRHNDRYVITEEEIDIYFKIV